MAAYTDASTAAVSPEINQTLAIYIWAWFIIAVLFTVAAVKSSLALFIDIFFLDLCLLLIHDWYQCCAYDWELVRFSRGFSYLCVVSLYIL